MSHVRSVRIHLGMPDSTGRQTPQEIPNSHVNIEADLVLKALGFDPEDLPALLDAPDLGVTGWGTLKIDWQSMMTSLDGVFAAGDIVRGASLVVWAVRDGRDAAERIHTLSHDQGAGRGRRCRGVTTMMTLYDFTGSGNGYKVRPGAGPARPAVQAVERDILKGETRTPEFLAKNPNGRIPDAAARGRQPSSSNRTPSSGTWPRAPGSRPRTGWARAETLQWMFFEQYSHEPFIATVRFWKHFLPKLTPLQEMELPGRMEKGYAALGVMEQHLGASSRIFVGDQLRPRRHRALCLHARRGRGRVQSRQLPARQRLDGARRQPARPRHDRPQELRRERSHADDQRPDVRGPHPEQRRKLAKELTEGTCRALGCTPDAVQIILTDIKKENWAEAGKLFSD